MTNSLVERLTDAETSLAIYDHGRCSEYWLRHPEPASTLSTQSGETGLVGWVMVPREPTSTMTHAALDASRQSDTRLLPDCKEIWASEQVYRAMLSAAPPSPDPEQAPTRPSVEGERCTMGVGCDEAGVCYAVAHGEPEQCPKASASDGSGTMTNSLVERLKRFTSFGCGQDDWPALRHDLIEALQSSIPPSSNNPGGVELPHHVKQFLMSLDDGETHTFDDEDWGRPAQDAENLGLGYVIVWKQGWEFRLNDTGQKAMAALQSQPSVIRTEGEEAKPIDMLLFCPNCGLKHVDERDHQWDNPPHRSHLCHDCGTIWRPADVPTNGVAAITTGGKADTIDLSALPASPSTVRDDALVLAARELLSWYGPFNPTKHPPEINGAWLRLQEALRSTPTALSPTIAPPDPVVRQMAAPVIAKEK